MGCTGGACKRVYKDIRGGAECKSEKEQKHRRVKGERRLHL